MFAPHMHTEIMIAGAGPAGLALAAELKRLGTSALIVDKLAEPLTTSRAAVVHARTLEALEPLGISDRLVELGIKSSAFVIRDRDKVLLNIDFAGLHTRYPFALMCPQTSTEGLLLTRLHELGGVVQRPCEITAVKPGAEEVEVTLTSNSHEDHVNARWLVACDGMHSTVRESAGIAFGGATYAENFVLADVFMDWPLESAETTAFFSGAGLLFVAPLPDNHFRIIAVVDEAPAQPAAEFLQNLLNERGPALATALVKDVVWSSRFRVHHQIAEWPRKGRILLCGDAAHVHSPAGGQGMNTGIQDAISLAQPLATAIETGDTAGLDQWATDRHKIAKDVIATTDRMTRIATATSPSGRALRNVALRFVGHIPALNTAVARKLAELQNR